MRIFLQFLGTLKCLWNVSLFEKKNETFYLPLFLVAAYEPDELRETVLKAILIFAHGSK